MTPYYTDDRVTLYCEDALEVMTASPPAASTPSSPTRPTVPADAAKTPAASANPWFGP